MQHRDVEKNVLTYCCSGSRQDAIRARSAEAKVSTRRQNRQIDLRRPHQMLLMQRVRKRLYDSPCHQRQQVYLHWSTSDMFRILCYIVRPAFIRIRLTCSSWKTLFHPLLLHWISSYERQGISWAYLFGPEEPSGLSPHCHLI